MIKLDAIHLNDGTHGLPKNPRFIRDERFAALVASVRDNPEFMPARPIIVDEAGTILGGNMRYLACRELGMTELPADWVQRVEGWPVEKKRRFIILDNRAFGADDFDLLKNEWGDIEELLAAGVEEGEVDDIFNSIAEPPAKETGGVPDADQNIQIRISIPASVWLGKREEIMGVTARMEKTYLAVVRIEE